MLSWFEKWGAQKLNDNRPLIGQHPTGGIEVYIGAKTADGAMFRIAERWIKEGKTWTNYYYIYEYNQSGRRRSFHFHNPEEFLENSKVLVHEHCEEPKADSCGHYYSSTGPISDPRTAMQRLFSAWQSEKLECNKLICLD